MTTIIKDNVARKSITEYEYNFNGKCCYDDDYQRLCSKQEIGKKDFWVWRTKMLYLIRERKKERCINKYFDKNLSP